MDFRRPFSTFFWDICLGSLLETFLEHAWNKFGVLPCFKSLFHKFLIIFIQFSGGGCRGLARKRQRNGTSADADTDSDTDADTDTYNAGKSAGTPMSTDFGKHTDIDTDAGTDSHAEAGVDTRAQTHTTKRRRRHRHRHKH